MYVENGKLVLTDHPCWNCKDDDGNPTGKVREVLDITCPNCGGTGRGPRGGRRGCKRCHGDGTTYKITDNLVECGTCKGTKREDDDYYDHITEEVWNELRIEVVNGVHRQTFAEAHIGAGLVSVTDYGDWRHGTAGDLIEKVRARGPVGQVCNLVKSPGYRTYLDPDDPRREDPDPTMPDFVGIFLNSQGYTVAAVHGQEVKVR